MNTVQPHQFSSPLTNTAASTNSLEAAFLGLLAQFPGAVLVITGPQYAVTFANDASLVLSGKNRNALLHHSVLDSLPLADKQSFREILDSVQLTAQPKTLAAYKTLIERNGHTETAWFTWVFQPVTNASGVVERMLIFISDETEKVLASIQREEEGSDLRRTRNQLDLSISIGNIGIWHWDVKNDVLTWSKEQLALYGLTPSGFGGHISDFHRRVLPEDLVIVRSTPALEKYQDNDVGYRFRIRRADGQIRWIQGRSHSHFNEAGELEYRTGVNIDITGEKLAWEQLQESEQRFRNTFDNAAVGIAHVAPDGSWLLVNERLCRIVGYSREELLSKTFQDITHPGDLETDLDLVRQVLEGERSSYVLEKRYIRKSGESVWVNLTVSLVRDRSGKPKYFIAIVENIHERKQAEETLKESEERQSLVIEAANIGLWDYDIRENVATLSERSRKFYNLPPGEPFSVERFLAAIHAEDRDRVAASTRRVLFDRESPTVYRDEYRVIRSDGKVRWMRAAGRVLVNEKGERYRFIGAMHDATEEKQFAAALQQLVNQRTLDLQTANTELQRSNEDLQQFAHVASHDLKEPIRKVRTFGSRLADEFYHTLPENGQLYLDKMLAAAERMFGLIDGILNYSTYNAIDSVWGNVNLHFLFQAIEDDLEVMLQEGGGKIERGNLPILFNGSAVLLNQLFYNLLNNALKFARPGVPPRVCVVYDVAKGVNEPVVPAAEAEKIFNRIRITDNGIGLRPEHAEKIFKSFTRLNSRDKYEGTGLGLALCKKIAERHGGYIYATGAEGEGATFTVLLPV